MDCEIHATEARARRYDACITPAHCLSGGPLRREIMSLSKVLCAAALALFVLPVQAEALQDAIAAVQRKDYQTAVRLLEPLARSGQPQAQLRLGMLYYHGHGVRESDSQARDWFERAAKQGLAEAQLGSGLHAVDHDAQALRAVFGPPGCALADQVAALRRGVAALRDARAHHHLRCKARQLDRAASSPSSRRA
jgi:TPR repeat protein